MCKRVYTEYNETAQNDTCCSFVGICTTCKLGQPTSAPQCLQVRRFGTNRPASSVSFHVTIDFERMPLSSYDNVHSVLSTGASDRALLNVGAVAW